MGRGDSQPVGSSSRTAASSRLNRHGENKRMWRHCSMAAPAVGPASKMTGSSPRSSRWAAVASPTGPAPITAMGRVFTESMLSSCFIRWCGGSVGGACRSLWGRQAGAVLFSSSPDRPRRSSPCRCSIRCPSSSPPPRVEWLGVGWFFDQCRGDAVRIIQRGEEPFGVQRGRAAGSGCGDGLAVAVVHRIPTGENAGEVRDRGG